MLLNLMIDSRNLCDTRVKGFMINATGKPTTSMKIYTKM